MIMDIYCIYVHIPCTCVTRMRPTTTQALAPGRAWAAGYTRLTIWDLFPEAQKELQPARLPKHVVDVSVCTRRVMAGHSTCDCVVCLLVAWSCIVRPEIRELPLFAPFLQVASLYYFHLVSGCFGRSLAAIIGRAHLDLTHTRSAAHLAQCTLPAQIAMLLCDDELVRWLRSTASSRLVVCTSATPASLTRSNPCPSSCGAPCRM